MESIEENKGIWVSQKLPEGGFQFKNRLSQKEEL